MSETESGLNVSGLPKEVQSTLQNKDAPAQAAALGMGGEQTTDWDVPTLNLRSSDKPFRKGNAGMTIGKDRESHQFSGFGGKPSNGQCASIDIVAGNQAFLAAAGPFPVDPDFKLAARVYISQKSNVDGFFELPAGTVGNTSMTAPRSTVAVKADTIRIIGRENIKLITRTDDFNSQGARLDNKFKRGFGIDLIGMADDADMQPLVKGDNLRECLGAMIRTLDVVTTMLMNFLEYDRQFKNAVQTHTHMSPFYGIETAPDFKATLTTGVRTAIASALNVDAPLLMDYPMELTSILNDYLAMDLEGKDQSAITAEKYILSKYNSTN